MILRSVNYGEADQVLTLYTRELGKISCLAKHSRLSKSRFGSTLQPFCIFEAQIRLRDSSSFGFLDSTMPLKAWPGLFGDLDRMNLAWRLCELANELEEQGASHPEFFDAVEGGLEALAVSELPEQEALLVEARFLELSGWAPRLDACVSCRKAYPFDPVRFSLAEGGLLCGSCRHAGAWLPLGAEALEALQGLFEGQATEKALSAQPVLRRFVEYQLGKALKSEGVEKQLRGLP